MPSRRAASPFSAAARMADAEAAEPEEQRQLEGDERHEGEDLDVAAGQVDVAEFDHAAHDGRDDAQLFGLARSCG